MANTYTQIIIHIVFTVKGRANLIKKPWNEEIYKYISGIIKSKNQKTYIVNGMPDHIHILVGMNGTISVSELVRDIKNNTSNFINNGKFVAGKFSWQEGYGAFSYSKSQAEKVYAYIANQEEHHRVKSFREEYVDMLEKFSVEYDEKHLFEWIDGE